MKTALTLALRYGLKPLLHPAVPRGIQRFAIGAATAITRGSPIAQARPCQLAGLPALHISKTNSPGAPAANARLLYLHGGGYVVGGFGSHRKLVSQVVAHTNTQAYLLDYRLAPEHPFPAALEDAVAAYKALALQGDGPLLIAGDSAGGGLAVALALAIAERSLPQPAGLVLFSPWVDLTLSGDSMSTRAEREAMLSKDWLTFAAKAYCQGIDPTTPQCSPLFASLEALQGLPRVLIQAGSEEMLLDDAQRLHQRLLAAGVESSLEVTEGCGHVFQVFVGLVPEADVAMSRVGAFVLSQTQRF